MQGREDQQPEVLRKLIDGAPVAMIIVDALGTITFAADACSWLFGYTPSELVGTNMLDYVDLEWNPLALESIGSAFAASGLRLPMLFRIRNKDGERLHIVEVTAHPQMDDPVVDGMAVYIRPWDEQYAIDDIIEALAGDAPLETKFDMFVRVMAGETLDSVGAVLFHPNDTEFTRAVASPRLDARLGGDPMRSAELAIDLDAVDAAAAASGDEVDVRDAVLDTTPWGRALATGTEQLVEVHDMSGTLREVATRQGYLWCWAYPVTDPDGAVRACLVMWRRDPRGMEESYLVWIRRLVRLTHMVLEQEQSRDQLVHAANHDPLTGLHNRASFFRFFQDVVDHANGDSFTGVLYLDLDGFKPVNDRLGHGAGDAVLVAIARRLSTRVRDTDLVARLGGDEFAVVCPDVESPAELEVLAERLATAAHEPVTIGDHTVQVGASVGVCVAPHGSCTIDALVEAADRALYDAKANNTGSWRIVQLGSS